MCLGDFKHLGHQAGECCMAGQEVALPDSITAPTGPEAYGDPRHTGSRGIRGRKAYGVLRYMWSRGIWGPEAYRDEGIWGLKVYSSVAAWRGRGGVVCEAYRATFSKPGAINSVIALTSRSHIPVSDVSCFLTHPGSHNTF